MLVRVTVLVAAALVIVPGASAASLSRPERGILREMNTVRAAHGLPALRFDGRLERAARFHSRDMVAHDYFAHGAFGGRMLSFNITGRVAGENLAWGVGRKGTARGIIQAWLASPLHRANLLNGSFRRVGVSAVLGSFSGYRGATVVTADFAG
jgi:uncharacterized protein YkwD